MTSQCDDGRPLVEALRRQDSARDAQGDRCIRHRHRFVLWLDGGFLQEENAIALCGKDGPSKAVASDYDDLRISFLNIKGEVQKSGELSGL